MIKASLPAKTVRYNFPSPCGSDTWPLLLAAGWIRSSFCKENETQRKGLSNQEGLPVLTSLAREHTSSTGLGAAVSASYSSLFTSVTWPAPNLNRVAWPWDPAIDGSLPLSHSDCL